MRSVVAWAVLAGCSSPPAPAAPVAKPSSVVAGPAPTPTVAEAPRPRSPLFVIGWSEWQSTKTENPTRLCAAGNALFVCGTGSVVRLVGDELVHGEALEKGLMRDDNGKLHGRIDDVFGHFPDDAWLVMRSGWNTGTVALYRFGNDEWSLAKKWKIEHVAGYVDLAHWKPGHVAALTFSLNEAMSERYAVEIVATGAPIAMPAIPKSKSKDPTCSLWLRWPHLYAMNGGALVIAGSRCDEEGPGWLRVVPGTKVAETHKGEPPYNEPPPSEFRIADKSLHRRRADGADELVVLPDAPLSGATPLVPFQVVSLAQDDVAVAARFSKGTVQGVAILRNTPAKAPLRF